ncbi:hypothetical protein SHI21_06570 [Bacteriovorax sp. PP10]|uniref:Uncharacterized protein n=1 Tax=Bacteriovorax antarcticus TaxID=3088717 RepID=A0ABU5VS27_9BACT|nr:hypothetical protein [Bacteriovorax sp. PP10]MEA9355854.1 hypothetical protein [Bacteriovorax sp. PP10]
MSTVPDYSLFPNKEEWGTGDEAMDNKLSVALKKVKDDLTLANIKEFYLYGLSLKPRAYNPAFHTTIDLVTKAFLFCFDPEGYNDQLMQKMKGDYESKKKITFQLTDVANILTELKTNKVYRYKGQIDFYLSRIEIAERNPFVRQALKRSPIDLHTKIIMKDFRAWMSGESVRTTYDDAFFNALKVDNQILLIENFGEFWYHQGQIFSFPLFEI